MEDLRQDKLKIKIINIWHLTAHWQVHLKQLEADTNISNDEAVHPIELIAKVTDYNNAKRKREIPKKDIMPPDIYTKQRKELRKNIVEFKKIEEFNRVL